MDDFNPFYLFILIPLSVILVYFSFSTIVLLAVLFVAGLWSCNVVKSPSIFKDLKDLALKTKTRGRKVKSIILNNSKFRRKPGNRGPNAIYHSEMPSTVKLTPGPERKPALNNKSFQANSFSSGSFYERSIDKSLNWSPKQISNNHSSSTSYRKANTSFLPSVKRALGLSEFSPREIRQTPPPTNFPSPSSAGFIPAVRLSKREKSLVGQPRTSTPRSPNVVRIAPPDPHKLSSPRLFHINTRNENRKPPDTQAVISALREKSLKRSYGGYDLDTSYTDYPVQQAKRRRQDSQQSTTSSSSLPPLPESLLDLASTGYTIPRLETPTLKRTAALDDLEESCSAKKLRKDGRINPILSSLSSSVRIAERDRQIKRKVSPFENKENSESTPKQAKTLDTSKTFLDRSDTVIFPTDEHLKTPAKDTDTSAKEEEVTSPGPGLPDKPKLEKKITLNQSSSARKRQNSLYSAMNKSFQKVPHANVIASMEDYERDMGAEKKRVQDMLEEIYKEETEKEKEKERKEAEEKAKTLQTSTVKPTVSTGVSVPSLAVSSGTSFTLPTSSVSTSATSAQTTANSVTFNFATVKSLSPSKTPVTTSAPPASLTTGGTTATVTSSGFMVSSKPQTTVAPLSSGAPTLGGFNTGGKSQTPSSSAPGLGNPISLSGTSSSVSGTAPFNFGTNSTASTTVSSLAPSPFSFGTSNTATTSTSSAPNFNFGVKPLTQSSGISTQPSTASGVTFSFNSQHAPTSSTQPSTLTFGTQQQNNNPAGQQGTPSFAFGQTAATSSSTQSNPSASTFSFKPFGQTSQNPQSTTTTSSIFGGQPSTGMPSFGNSQSTNTATSGFPAGQGSSMPAFGHGATSTTPAFGQGSTTAPPPYGQGSTSVMPAFGQGSTSTTPSFGQGSASAPTAFGQGSTSATNESLNQIVNSKAPKFKHFGGSNSLELRLNAAVAQKNEGRKYIHEVNAKHGLSPGKFTLSHSYKLDKKPKAEKEKEITKHYKRLRLSRKKSRCCKQKSQETREGVAHKTAIDLENPDENIDRIPEHIRQPVPDRVEITEKDKVIVFDLETTGFGYDADMTQMSAIDGCREFDQYIYPKKPISATASKVTRITKVNGCLYYKGQLVPSHSLDDTLEQFILWLPCQSILVAHNGKNFDSKILINHLRQKPDLLLQFCEKVKGFADTLPIFKSLLPGRNHYNQESLVKDILEEDSSVCNFHNSLEDVRALKRLIDRMLPSKNDLSTFTFSVTFIEDCLVYHDQKKRCLATYGKMLHEKAVSKCTAEKMAGSGLTETNLRMAFKRNGRDGITSLLSEDIDGKPLISKSESVFQKLCNYFEHQ